MRNHARITAITQQAAREQRCFFGSTEAERAALRRRLRAGELVKPYPAIYADAAQWASLNPAERHMHLLRALHLRHPTWVFAGLSAASVLGLDPLWHTYNGTISIASPHSSNSRDSTPLRYRRMEVIPSIQHQGFLITTPERTLIDCGLQLSFRDALPLFDAALRLGLTTCDAISALCDTLHVDCTAVRTLLQHASGIRESGGESFCLGTMYEEGFHLPLQQQVFRSPHDPNRTIRVDFMYRLHDGRIIVIEFDGMRKYVDPAMTSNRDIRRIVHEERARETDLRDLGATTIVRLDYNEVFHRTPMVDKLLAAGVPCIDNRWRSARPTG